MLNKELLRRNKSLSIVENPNEFDYLTLEDSVNLIKEGQKNYRYLT